VKLELVGEIDETLLPEPRVVGPSKEELEIQLEIRRREDEARKKRRRIEIQKFRRRWSGEYQ